MSWLWIIESGRLYDDGGELIGVGYSGKGIHKNNPDSQGLKNLGPIPVGQYAILSPRNTSLHGPFVMPLLPSAETRAYILSLKREPDTFLMHGDSVVEPGAASEGCPVMSRDVREEVWSSNDHNLEVQARLSD